MFFSLQKWFGWKSMLQCFTRHTPHASTSTSYKILWKKLHKHKFYNGEWIICGVPVSFNFNWTIESNCRKITFSFMLLLFTTASCTHYTLNFDMFFGYFFAALFKVHTSALCIAMDPFFIVPLIIINPNSFSSSAPPHSIHKIRNKRKNKDFLFFLHMKQYGLLLLLFCLHNTSKHYYHEHWIKTQSRFWINVCYMIFVIERVAKAKQSTQKCRENPMISDRVSTKNGHEIHALLCTIIENPSRHCGMNCKQFFWK